jgi:hypothetical protein
MGGPRISRTPKQATEKRMKPALIYDIEIVKAIASKNEAKNPGIEYCAGWGDHANMGVSVIGAYDYAEDRYRVFCADNFSEFAQLAGERLCVGFNSVRFDNAVIRASNITAIGDADSYDILREMWIAAGVGNGDPFVFDKHAGYSLDATCEKNFGTRKTGNGALAPVLWQQGKIGAVIDYCLNDIRLTKQLFDKILAGQPIVSPKDGRELSLRVPTL